MANKKQFSNTKSIVKVALTGAHTPRISYTHYLSSFPVPYRYRYRRGLGVTLSYLTKIVFTDFCHSAPILQTFEIRLDKFWNETDAKYNFKSDLGTRTNRSKHSQLDLNTVQHSEEDYARL